jgi:hypothetical protein
MGNSMQFGEGLTFWARLFLGILFDSYDGGDMFFQNVRLSPNYMSNNPEDCILRTSIECM